MGKIAKKETGKRASLKTYEEIRFKFILGETLKSLSDQYNIPYATLKDRSHKEKWGLLRDVKDKEAAYEYRRALIDKSYDYIGIYEKIRKKAEGMLKNANTPKDLNMLAQVVKTVHEQELLCFALRGGDDLEED